MKIKVVTGGSLFLAGKNLINDMDLSDSEAIHYVLVPDRYSLQVENLIMDLKNIESTFNIEVLGLSRLANKILKELGVKGETLNSDETLLLTQQAIENVKHEFKSFKKSTIGFAQEVSKVIAQFKSSRLAPQDIKPRGCTPSVANKYHDLALIYQEYENLILNRLDANKLLAMFSELVLQSQILKNTYLYLVGFDSFTSEMFSIISSLAKSAKGVFISLPKGELLGNSYIYEDDIINKLTILCQEENISIEVQERENLIGQEPRAILNNLYSENPKSVEDNGFFKPIACQSLLQEVMTVGKLINSYVRQGGKYSKVVIACSDLEKYKPYLERCFTELEIPFFADLSTTADKLILSDFVFKALRVLASGFSNSALLDFFSHEIVKKDNTQEILQRLITFNVHGKFKTYKYLSSLADDELNFFDQLSACLTVGNFIEILEAFVERNLEGYHKTLEAIKEEYSYDYNLNIQAEEYLKTAFESIKRVQASYQTSLPEFIKKLELLLSFNKVSTVPTYVDSVMIGDATSSYYVETPILFVLGGGESLPRVQQDNGLVSDYEISSVNFIRELEPSIRMLNRRNRFKLFNLLLLAKDNLFVTYRTVNDDGKKVETPNFIESLCNIFNVKPKRASSYFRSLYNQSDDNFIAGLGSRKCVLKELAGGQKSNNLDNRQMASLMSAVKFDLTSLYLPREQINGDTQELYFPKNYTKVTELETYFSCPFKHFVRYGLKLEERETSEIQAKDIGNICHAIAEIFVKKYRDKLGELDDKQVWEFVNLNFDKVIDKFGLKAIIQDSDDGKLLEGFVKWQCHLILSRICYEQKSSGFKPIFEEKELSGMTLEIGDTQKQIPLIGKVDRIDKCGDYFRIIDYKTGSVNPLIKDLFYGDKLQLFVYQKGVADELKLACGGVFYFDCKLDFYEEDSGVLLKGLLADKDEVISKSDLRLGVIDKSDLVAVSLRKKAKDGSSFKGSGICKSDFSTLQEYAVRVSSKALGEICDGFIEPKPDENACEKCAFKGICLYDKSRGVRIKSRVSEEDISKIIKGGQDE